MNIQEITLDQATEVALIIGAIILIFKAYGYPIGRFFRKLFHILSMLTPVFYIKEIRGLNKRVCELEMQNFQNGQEITDLHKRILKINNIKSKKIK